MKNPYFFKIAVITGIKGETPDTKLFTLRLKKSGGLKFSHGQFVEVGIPGWGEAPFDVCSRVSDKNSFEICVRKAGVLTSKLHQLKKGEELTVRGPYGQGWPKFKELSRKNLLLVAGGLGFVPMRSLIEEIIDKKIYQERKIQVFYGSSCEDYLLFRDDYKRWGRGIKLEIIFDKATGASCPEFHRGLVTELFDKLEVVKEAAVFLCGPPIMYRFILPKLEEHNFSEKDIYLSFERRMHCGVGICEHCAIGPYYVCKDGPVFSYDKIKDIEGAI